MAEDDVLYALWLAASRRARQPQCMYPQVATLREFARAIWFEGHDAKSVTQAQLIMECPY